MEVMFVILILLAILVGSWGGYEKATLPYTEPKSFAAETGGCARDCLLALVAFGVVVLVLLVLAAGTVGGG